MHRALLLSACLLLATTLAVRGDAPVTLGSLELAVELLAEDDFSADLERWVVEGNSRVWLEEGKLHIQTPERGYATVWYREPFEGDQLIRFQARVFPPREASNVNFFFCASLPEAGDFLAPERTGQYAEYHRINNYTMTFTGHREGVRGAPGYMRLRKNPGFVLVDENPEIRAEIETDYDISILKVGPRIQVYVNGVRRLQWQDDPEEAFTGGYAGFRTFWSHLAIDGIKVYRVTACREMEQAAQ